MATAKQKHPSVEVVWLDAWVSAGEMADTEANQERRPIVMKDIGFLVSRTRKGVTLAMSVSEQGCFRTVNFIPKGMIKSVRILK